MPLRVDDVEAHIVERTTDGNVLLLLVHQIGSGEDGTLCGAIDIIEAVARWRCDAGQFLAACGEVQQRVVLNVRGKLESHLSGHKRVGDVLALEVVVQGYQVKAQLLGYDVYGGSTGQSGIEVHHAGIEAIAGIGRHVVLGLQCIVALIPVAEGNEVGMCQLATLRHACRTARVEKDEEAVGSGF